ncbi:MAG: 30S ribosomal protein S3 [Kiritimatiellae bacterium]|nr:30S ribosomal protein S3 [Kiritimatiellia bacterium]
MGQKVNPIGFRVGVDHDWRSRWFADKRSFGDLLAEDDKIRGMVAKSIKEGAVSAVRIERYANRVRVNIHTARPGIVMGKGGEDVERLRKALAKATKKEVFVEISEIRDADANAQLVAESIADQIVRRITVKRAMKRAQRTAMEMGVDGIKMLASGRINGAELSRVEWMKEGKVPLHTLRAKIEYGFAEAHTTAGLIGVKVWICKSEKYQPRANNRRRNQNASHA